MLGLDQSLFNYLIFFFSKNLLVTIANAAIWLAMPLEIYLTLDTEIKVIIF